MKKIWQDITLDKNGNYVAKDVFKAIAFLVGLLIIVFAAGACYFGKVIAIEGGLILLSLAFGIQTVKDVVGFLHNKTQVENGCAEACDSPAPDKTPTPDTPSL